MEELKIAIIEVGCGSKGLPMDFLIYTKYMFSMGKSGEIL